MHNLLLPVGLYGNDCVSKSSALKYKVDCFCEYASSISDCRGLLDAAQRLNMVVTFV